MRDAPGFWTFFAAVLAALIAHDLLRLAVAAVGLSVAVNGLKGVASPASVQSGPTPTQQRLMGPPETLPGWPSVEDALRMGSSRACVNGLVADRLDDRWQQHRDQPCRVL